ncbi:MAG: hypothetical protein NTW15_22415, partial [Burkholderiales bacterium]|nr:hypothetical protein [Burkholderiales bacterium]
MQLSPSEYTIDLSSVTAAEGGYVLTLTAAGSGIQDRVTNAMAVNSTTSWTVDTTAPTANVVDVTPDPRTTEVGVVTITFNEPVIGLTIGDVMLTRDGSVLDLTGTPITQISSTQYEIDLTDFTRFDGTVFNELGVGAPFSAIVPGQYMLSVSAASGTVI